MTTKELIEKIDGTTRGKIIEQAYDFGFQDGYKYGYDKACEEIELEYYHGYTLAQAYESGKETAMNDCDGALRELSNIKSGCSEWLDEHDRKLINLIICKLNQAGRYRADSITHCLEGDVYPENEVFVVDDVYDILEEFL